MTERLHLFAPRRVALLASALLMLGGPASGQGPYPPVPGPFPVMSGAGFGAQMPAPQARAAEQTDSRARPRFQPPANAMRMPYWMQAPVAEAPETNAAETPEREAPAPAVVALTITAALTLLFFFFNGPVLDLERQVVAGMTP